MAEIGEDLPFAPHALGRVARRNAAQQFDRDALVKILVDSFGEEHGAHAAAADFAGEPVWPELASARRCAGNACGRIAQLTDPQGAMFAMHQAAKE